GWHTGYTRLDWRGRPVIDPGRGIDPTNTKPLHLEERLDQEYVMLNKTADLSLRLDKPTGIFDSAAWKKLGYNPGIAGSILGQKAPSLTEMQTTDGANAWQRYRDLVYKGKATADKEVSTGRYGDQINIGSVTIKKGENFQDALARIIETDGYNSLTQIGRAHV